MKCANCDRDAIYTVDHKVASPSNYCNIHVPSFDRAAAEAGFHPLAVPAKPAKSSKKDAPAEEAPAEDAPAE